MTKQIKVQGIESQKNYEESKAALLEYDPKPTVTVTIRLKGQSIHGDAVGAVIETSKEYGLEVEMALTGSWPADDGPQMRLWPPVRAQKQTVLDDIDQATKHMETEAEEMLDLPPGTLGVGNAPAEMLVEEAKAGALD